jgi:metacaspase-1
MAKGYALNIGVNRVNPRFYSGAAPLRGCVRDAQDIGAIARARGFEVLEPLFDDNATAAALEGRLGQVRSRVEAGDMFLLQYSGHGMDMRSFDVRGDRNTAWCLFDGPYIDDKLFDYWLTLPAGVRVLVLSDSCHSGSAVREVQARNEERAAERSAGEEEDPVPRGLDGEAQRATVDNNRQFFAELKREADALKARNAGRVAGAGVLLLSGCDDSETSGDLPSNGVFTGVLKQVWDNGNFPGLTYEELWGEVSSRVAARSSRGGRAQNPKRFLIGDPVLCGNFLAMPPFTI